MASLPGQSADVYFGDTEKPLPNWRESLPTDDSDDDRELTAEERKVLVAMIGFDPSEKETDNGE